MVSSEMQSIIAMLRAQPEVPDVTFPQMRDGFEAMVAVFPAAPDVKREKVDAAGVPAEWVTVPESGSRVLYWLHGGGYCIGSPNTHADFVSRIARVTAARALLVDYRMGPEHPFPAAVDDAVAGYRWLLAQGVSPADVVIGGDSAGGGLTAAALVALRDAGDPLPSAAVLLSPWTDLACEGGSMTSKAEADPMVQKEGLMKMAAAYLGGADARTPLASPIHADLRGLPPMLVHVGTAETLLDDSVRLAERAQAAGVDVTLEPGEEMIHVWHFFAFAAPESRQAIDRIGEWVRAKKGAVAQTEPAAAS